MMQSAETELNRCRDARQVQRSSEAQETRTPASPAGSGGCTEQLMSGGRVGARAWRNKIMGAWQIMQKQKTQRGLAVQSKRELS